ncbi:MAG: hypothetical protein ABIP19_09040, partial [Dermatophilaceae bacterium]
CERGHGAARGRRRRGGRSLIAAGGSCGSVHAWNFWAIWNRKASVARVSGLGSRILTTVEAMSYPSRPPLIPPPIVC